jgi:hypothetical protein
LQKIADILETDISAFLDHSKLTIQNQTNHEGAYGNGYIENLNQCRLVKEKSFQFIIK